MKTKSKNNQNWASGMDSAALEAEKDLAKTDLKSLSDFTSWWRKWYLKAGHKRLGRILVKHSKKSDAASPSTKNISALPKRKSPRALSELNYQFSRSVMDTYSLFSVSSAGSLVTVTFNESHPGFSSIHMALNNLGITLEPQPNRSYNIGFFQSDSPENIDANLLLISSILSWATLENETPTGQASLSIAAAREDWGRYMRDMLKK